MGDSPTNPADDFENGAAAEEKTHPPAACAKGLYNICAGVEGEANTEENSRCKRWLVAILDGYAPKGAQGGMYGGGAMMPDFDDKDGSLRWDMVNNRNERYLQHPYMQFHFLVAT